MDGPRDLLVTFQNNFTLTLPKQKELEPLNLDPNADFRKANLEAYNELKYNLIKPVTKKVKTEEKVTKSDTISLLTPEEEHKTFNATFAQLDFTTGWLKRKRENDSEPYEVSKTEFSVLIKCKLVSLVLQREWLLKKLSEL